MFSGLRPYGGYIDVDVPGIERVPDGWTTQRLKTVSRLAYGDALRAEVRNSGDIAVMGSNGRIGWHDRANTSGETIVVGRKGSFGKVVFSEQSVFVVDTAYYADRRSTSANLRWLFHALLSLRLDGASRDSAIPGLDRGDAYRRILLVPPLAEQDAIVKYLAHAHRRIDHAIDAKRRLINLLEEQKQAVIRQTATRGADPTVPMQESEAGWIDAIPAKWRVAALGRVARVFSGSTPSRLEPRFWAPPEVPWVSSGKVNEVRITVPTELISRVGQKAGSLELAPAGTVIVGLVGQGRTRGMAAILDIDSCVNQNLAAVVPGDGLDGEFLRLVLTAAYEDLRMLGRGGNQAALNGALLRAFPVPLPSIVEQRVIVSHIESENAVADEAINHATREIELLEEFHTRLTADVVTGQVDVREIAAGLPDIAPAEFTGIVTGSSDDDLSDEAVDYLEDVTA